MPNVIAQVPSGFSRSQSSQPSIPRFADRRNGDAALCETTQAESQSGYGNVTDEGALVQRPSVGRPEVFKRAEFEYDWTGRIVLIARRASLGDLGRRFDVTWFLQAMHKYRRLLGEVLVASFFLQLFALVSPLFFQVVIDKVLVHRGLTTLDVLIIGLLVVSIFESLLAALRTYVFAHTTSRIDVE